MKYGKPKNRVAEETNVSLHWWRTVDLFIKKIGPCSYSAVCCGIKIRSEEMSRLPTRLFSDTADPTYQSRMSQFASSFGIKKVASDLSQVVKDA